MAETRRTEWARRYPPLVGGLVAAVLAATVLPSSLNVPQTNPQQTLEFAPVPPSDEDAPPPPGGGDLGSLGLGTSSGPETAGVGGDGPGAAGPAGGPVGPGAPGQPPPPPPLGEGSRPSTKRCVGNPPRQTEDPLSPPCVAFFDGDNGGATYQGVKRDEVRILFALDGNTTLVGGNNRGSETTPPDGCFDLTKPPPEDDPDEDFERRSLRIWQRYFNQRYQAYNRAVKFTVCYAPQNAQGGSSPEDRRAQAAEQIQKIDPFAVLPRLQRGFTDEYLTAMAGGGVMVFEDSGQRSEAFFRRFAPQIYSFSASLEQRADIFGDYICRKVAPYRVSVSGNSGENGEPRVYGLLWTDIETNPYHKQFRDAVTRKVNACGVEFAEEASSPRAGRLTDTAPAPYANEGMSRFQNEGVTTVVYVGGYDQQWSKAAGQINYRPEWIIGGGGVHDGSLNGKAQDQSVYDGHAYVITQMTRKLPGGLLGTDKACQDAFEEASPDDKSDQDQACNIWYDRVRQLFTGIQVAGPRLTPDSVDEGFHAIPQQRSSTPFVPACFYLPGDYTCVKDATVMRWDAQARNGEGCWRMIQDGQRYTAGRWPRGNVHVQNQSGDVCQNFAGGGGVAAGVE